MTDWGAQIGVDVLVEKAEEAFADWNHENLCHCDLWPNGCLNGLNPGMWGTSATDMTVLVVLRWLNDQREKDLCTCRKCIIEMIDVLEERFS